MKWLRDPFVQFLLVGATRPGLSEEWVAGLTRLEHVSHRYVPRLESEAVARVLHLVLPYLREPEASQVEALANSYRDF